MKRTFEVSVTQVFEITLDEDKMDEKFMEEFRESFFPYFSLEDHAKHIAQLLARGIYYGFNGEFWEGYGKIKEDLGASFRCIEQWEEVNWAREHD